MTWFLLTHCFGRVGRVNKTAHHMPAVALPALSTVLPFCSSYLGTAVRGIQARGPVTLVLGTSHSGRKKNGAISVTWTQVIRDS